MTRQFNDPSLQNFLKRKAFRTLSAAEEQRLFVAARAGDKAARRRLIEANTKFAAAVVGNYQDRGVDVIDLTSEAILGLIRAVDRFDHTKGFKFITYAVWWIRQGILLAIAAQSRAYRLPPSMVSDYGKVDRAKRRLEQRDGRVPSVEEIAEEMEVSTADVEGILEALTLPYYLEHEAPEDGFGTFEGLLADPKADAEAGARAGLDRRYVMRLLERLDPREAAIVRRYYGLDGLPESTLQEISDDLNITRERVRQIKDKALGRLARVARNLELPLDQQKAITRRPKEATRYAVR